MVRVAAALFCVTLGLGAGYLLWGERVTALAAILDRLTLEYDAVRARAGTGTSTQSLTAVLESLNDRVREQGATLAQQTDALSRVIGEREDQVAEVPALVRRGPGPGFKSSSRRACSRARPWSARSPPPSRPPRRSHPADKP
jgi:hypothetical protein